MPLRGTSYHLSIAQIFKLASIIFMFFYISDDGIFSININPLEGRIILVDPLLERYDVVVNNLKTKLFLVIIDFSVITLCT